MSETKSKRFSISSDASNKGNVKLFPIGVQYFTIEKGIVNFVLDFYEDSNESSDAIYGRLRECLAEKELRFDNMIAYSADNASVNFGKNHSVFTQLKGLNKFMVSANCNCHVLHNTVRYALNHLPFDVENLVLKMYSHFSISSKRVNSLKSCYDFTDNDFKKILRHVTTRWLSLYPAVNRIIENINPIKEYFVGVGTEDCAKVINEFVWSEKVNGMTIPELYLQMSSHLMDIFHKTIKTIEQKSINASNLFDLMFKLKTQLENRLKYEFFGSIVNTNIKEFDEGVREDFTENAKIAYQRAIDYLNRNFDFNNSPFKLFSALNLDDELVFQKLVEISELLNIQIDQDSIFDEITSFNALLKQLDTKDIELDCIAKYCKILCKNDFKNLVKILESVMAIPIGNDFVERIFSHMQKILTDDRCHMNVSLIRAEICISNNFDMNCSEFLKYVKTNEKLLKSVKSAEKYNYK